MAAIAFSCNSCGSGGVSSTSACLSIWPIDPATARRLVVRWRAEDLRRNILSFMDKPTLDERCAELKARMLSAHQQNKGSNPARIPATAAVRDRSRGASSQVPKAIEAVTSPPIEIRNPHPLVKAALAGMRDVGEDYGGLQFRWRGFVDVRVNKASARRAMKMMDTLIKRVEAAGLNIKLAPKYPDYDAQSQGLTFVSDGKEGVQVSVIEKTVRSDNPAWGRDNWREERCSYAPTGRLSLVLDADLYRAQTWTDKRGHVIEEYVDAVVISIRQTLEDRHKGRLEAEQSRQREIEHQRIQAEADRQNREQEKRIEQLKDWAKAGVQAERLRAFCQHGKNTPKGTKCHRVGQPSGWVQALGRLSNR